ncbi:hypothetical protein E2I00_017826 [Balaenoptera physalus]|uniref:V-type proton ATPase subunit C n=1 Tax=Balaenoptera physalus TaxID=9770 RepID=A0A643CIL6_BALPH|nr:hypothetical protein E2I00_017826 [Balaenoptera physalus]
MIMAQSMVGVRDVAKGKVQETFPTFGVDPTSFVLTLNWTSQLSEDAPGEPGLEVHVFTWVLISIASKEDFVLDSEYLIVLLAPVPKPSDTRWLKAHESLLDMMVPPSTKLMVQDEGCVYTVTLL